MSQFAEIYEGFRLEHLTMLQVSYASLVDRNGDYATPGVVLECDGSEHVSDIFKAVDDYWLARTAEADAIAEQRETAERHVEILRGAA